jgi:hypothetical protein
MGRTYRRSKVERSTFKHVKHFGRFALATAPTVEQVKLSRRTATSTSGGEIAVAAQTQVVQKPDTHLE